MKERLRMKWSIVRQEPVGVWKTRDPSRLDPELKKLALSTFSIALLLYLANDYFL